VLVQWIKEMQKEYYDSMVAHLEAHPGCKVKDGLCNHNKARKIIDQCYDANGDLYYLLTFKPTRDRWF